MRDYYLYSLKFYLGYIILKLNRIYSSVYPLCDRCKSLGGTYAIKINNNETICFV